MEKIKNWLKLFLKKMREGPPEPPNMGICAHCGTQFERPRGMDIEPEVECFHYPDTTEYIFRYPNTWHIKIKRQSPDGRHALIYLDLCEFCFLLKPKFAYIKLGNGAEITYFWENAYGELYEKFDYGKNGPSDKQY